jgi:hypothetical protein
MRDRYRQAWSVANGQYITELDVNNEDANVSSSFRALRKTNSLAVQSFDGHRFGKISQDQGQVRSKRTLSELSEIRADARQD